VYRRKAMRPILIGAGRGSRLAPYTDAVPKCLVPVLGKPMLQRTVEALEEAGFSKRDIVFIGGYRLEEVKKRYPEFTYVENAHWPSNNVLLSLFCAQDFFGNGFLCSYTDIVYEATVVHALLAAPYEITLACDTDWRHRYEHRTLHPESDGEKVRLSEGNVLEVSRTIAPEEASGEFIGVACFRENGVRKLIDGFSAAEKKFASGLFRDNRSFQKAYLIDLLQWMKEQGTTLGAVTTQGGYMEIDTQEDLQLAPQWFKNLFNSASRAGSG
jgi:L-glutamine-phosphate cytidylyltransferase